MATLLGAYRPGTTLLHRLPAGAKLSAVALLGTVVVMVRGPVSAAVALGLALGLVAWSRAGVRTVLGALRSILVVAVALAAYRAWQGSWQEAVEPVTDLLALVLVASVLTTTTPVDEVLDAVVRGLRPFRRLGVDAEKVALAFSLVLRALPTTLDLAAESRDAARARGLERDPRARLTPVVLRAVAHARATGDALHARGIGDD